MFRLSSVALILLLFVPNAVGQKGHRESERMQALFALEQQLKIEQAKLQQLQDQLDRADKDLDDPALRASSRRP